MSITVFIRTPSEVHDVEISGDESLLSLYNKVAEAVGIDTVSFLLHFEGNQLALTAEILVQDSGLVEASEVTLESVNSLRVNLSEIAEQQGEIKERISLDQNLHLFVDVDETTEGLDFESWVSASRLTVEDPWGKTSSLGNGFMEYSSFLTTLDLNLPEITQIENEFCSYSLALTSVDISRCTSVTCIGDFFLTGCMSLTTVVLPTSVEKIGIYFLAGSSLASIDLSPLQNLHDIGDNFMNFTQIQTIDLSPLKNVKSIGSNFLSETRVTLVDTTPLCSLQRVGSRFLSGCSELTKVDLQALQKKNVSIGQKLLEDSGVHDIELKGIDTLQFLYEKAAETSGFGNDREIQLTYEGEELEAEAGRTVQETALTDGCEIVARHYTEIHVHIEELKDTKHDIERRLKARPGLLLIIDASGVKGGILTLTGNETPSNVKRLKFSDAHGTVTTIDKEFLSNHDCLEAVDLSGLGSVKHINDGFLTRCPVLSSVDLMVLTREVLIGNHFLSQCPVLKGVCLSRLYRVTCVGSYFLSGCRSLVSVDLSVMQVACVRDEFLSGCTLLSSLDLSPLRNVRSVGGFFLQDCRSLRDVDLTPLKTVKLVGFSFLGGTKVPRRVG